MVAWTSLCFYYSSCWWHTHNETNQLIKTVVSLQRNTNHIHVINTVGDTALAALQPPSRSVYAHSYMYLCAVVHRVYAFLPNRCHAADKWDTIPPFLAMVNKPSNINWVHAKHVYVVVRLMCIIYYSHTPGTIAKAKQTYLYISCSWSPPAADTDVFFHSLYILFDGPAHTHNQFTSARTRRIANTTQTERVRKQKHIILCAISTLCKSCSRQRHTREQSISEPRYFITVLLLLRVGVCCARETSEDICISATVYKTLSRVFGKVSFVLIPMNMYTYGGRDRPCTCHLYVLRVVLNVQYTCTRMYL